MGQLVYTSVREAGTGEHLREKRHRSCWELGVQTINALRRDGEKTAQVRFSHLLTQQSSRNTSVTSRHQDLWGVSPPSNRTDSTAGTPAFPPIQFSSDTTYLETASDSTGWGRSHSRSPSTSDANHKTWLCGPCFCWAAVNWVLMTPSPGLINLL